MRTMSRLAALAATLVLAVVAGCGDDEEGGSGPGTSRTDVERRVTEQLGARSASCVEGERERTFSCDVQESESVSARYAVTVSEDGARLQVDPR